MLADTIIFLLSGSYQESVIIRSSSDLSAFAIIMGMAPLLLLSHLPPKWLWWLIAVITLLCALSCCKSVRWLALSGVAFLWATAQAGSLLDQLERYSDKRITVNGVIRGLYIGQAQQAYRKVLFQVTQVDQHKVSSFTIDLSHWVTAEPVLEGQQWQLQLILRPVHSRLNEGGFDRQRWSVAQRQVLSGKVLKATLLQNSLSLRQRSANWIAPYISQLSYQDILWALAMGERELMQEPRRQVLQLTGTAHLMAISGLHISLASLFGWSISRLLQFMLPLRWITPQLPIAISVLSGWAYVWLSGANPPALRAGIALLFWSYMRLSGTNYSGWQLWLRGVALLLIIDPLYLLSDSFLLSCSAVAGLIFWFQWLPLPYHMRKGLKWLPLRWLHLETGIFLLLAPFQVVLFQGVSLGSLLANLWAVPLVSLLTVPLILLALLMTAVPLLGETVWQLANMSLQLVFSPLGYFVQGWVFLQYGFLLTAIGGWLLVPVLRLGWWRSRPLSLFALTLLLLLPRWRTTDALWRATMLDVGHGLAIVIERNGRALVYDTGNAWEGGSMAQREILPYLRWHGLIVDQIIISHQHQDHIGGLPELLQFYPDSELITSSSAFSLATVASSLKNQTATKRDIQPCLQGKRWQWQGLQLEILWPKRLVERPSNPDSCTVRISDGRHSMLLMGDLELAQERELVATYHNQLRSDILQVPHHGSRTSSSALFLRTVQPQLALNSTARYNPWRLPSIKVRERYRKQEIRWYNTAQEGQLTLLFYPDSWQVQTFRQHLQPRWYHDWFGLMAKNG